MLKSLLRSFSYEHFQTINFGNAHALTAFIEVHHVKGSSMCKVRASEGPSNPNCVYPSLRQSCSRKSKSYFENRFILPYRRLVCSHAVISLRVRAAWAKPIKSVTHEVNLRNGFSLVRDTLSGLLAYFISGFNENFVWSKKKMGYQDNGRRIVAIYRTTALHMHFSEMEPPTRSREEMYQVRNVSWTLETGENYNVKKFLSLNIISSFSRNTGVYVIGQFEPNP